ncbi:hypothetical protein BME20236_II0610 [Brucella melitensis]|nr:fumarate reductase/succinate dehydrogenase flavodomain protein [Brucella melitensis bv. 2 str. 63/9]ALM36102.1 hypothetical protein BME20236_II0610 [Brucella melitensis]
MIAINLSYCRSRCTTGSPARKNAAAKEGAFQRIVAVIATAAEACGFACCIKSRYRFAAGVKHGGLKIGMQAAKRLAGENMQFDRNERTVGRVEQRMKWYRAGQPVAKIGPCITDRHDLRILGIAVGNFAVTRLDLCADMGGVKKVFAGQPVHACHKLFKGLGGNEILALVDKRLDGLRWGFCQGGF